MAAPVLKTTAEIEAMRPAGRIVAEALKLVEEMVAPGMTTGEMDAAVEQLIRKAGGVPAFLNYPAATPGTAPFPASICASLNEEVVHGIPGERILEEGDIISVDVGVAFNGFYGDAARTYAVGGISRKTGKLLEVTEDCLKRAIAEVRDGNCIRDISGAVQKRAESSGYSVVRKFVGHGIGREMHEPPQVPNYVAGLAERLGGECNLLDTRIMTGIALAIEPMVNMGGHDVLVDRNNGWTVFTKDRSLSAHFEHSVALGEDGIVVLTEF